MDIVNTKIGQTAAREAASTISEKTFNSANLIGFQTGASAFTSGENAAVTQQVRFVDKTVADLSQKASEEKRLKENPAKADTKTREEKVDISEQLGNISQIFDARGTELAFSVDNETSRQVITVKDRVSGDVIRQIPSEEVLSFAAKVQDLATTADSVGLLLDRQA